MNARRRPELRLELPASDLPAHAVFHGTRWAMVAGLAMLTYLLYPVARGFDLPLVQAGEVAPVEVVSPFAFTVAKSPSELAREAGALAGTVRPIYEYRGGVADSAAAQIDALFAALDTAATAESLSAVARQFGVRLTPEEAVFLGPRAQRAAFRRALLRMVREQLVRGVPASGVIEFELSREVVLRRDGREQVIPRDSVLGFQSYLALRNRVHPAPNSSLGDRVFVKLLHGVFRPTLVPNQAETEALRAELRASVDSVKDVVQANERIIAAHEVVTPQASDRLLALRAELLRRDEGGEGSRGGMVGQVLTNGIVLAIFWVLLLLYRREIYGDRRAIGVLALLFAVTIIGARVNLSFLTPAPELIPIPFAAMVISALMGGRLAALAAIVLAVLLGSQAAYGGQNALYIAMVGGVAAALSLRTIRRRTQLLTAFAVVAAGFALAAVTVGLRYGWPAADVGASVLRGAVNGFVSAGLAVLALPILEPLAGVTTDLTLLELSDPSRPLLRRLETEAPGTYAHSVAMANLCEAACNAIGANGLLARVGCYYHDIGKLRKPQFFVENQRPGTNPHDKLKPDVSASIIRSHVKDGLALAEEHGLPDVVKAFIPEHHGTLEISYFLDRARTRNGSDEIAPGQYRYPGPAPQSVETAVAMLADGVEAAVRVLDDPSPDKLRDAIGHVIQQRIASGQLAEAPLTLAQLDRVREEFVRVLSGMHHVRIDYPVAAGGIRADWDTASGA